MVPLTSQTLLGRTGVEVGAELDGCQTGTKQKNMSNQLGGIVIFMEERMRGSSHSGSGLYFQSWRAEDWKHDFPAYRHRVIDSWTLSTMNTMNKAFG